MKFGVKFLSGLVFLSYLCFGQSYSHITNLRGIEDSSGHTQLFYRYLDPSPGCWSKSIFHLDVYNHIDTLFIYDAASDPIGEGCRGDFVYDYEFFHNNVSEFIYGGYDFYFDPVPLLRRHDGDVQLPFAGFGGVTEIEISPANNNLVYAAIEQSALYRSTDGGYNFKINLDSLPLIDNAIISLSKNNDSQIYGIDDNKLVRSEDEGYSYTIVDNSFWDENSDLFYDADGSHIYGLSNYYDFSTESYLSNIFVSNDNGNQSSWNSVLESESKIIFTNDEITTGEIYYSTGKQIFKSTDYGGTFNLYKTLERKVTGLYKKSGTNILYASTPLKIFEITHDTITIVKQLTLPQQAIDWYPLEVGNKWIYNNYREQFDPPGSKEFIGITVLEITGDTTLSNQKTYFKLKNELLFWNIKTGLIRQDLDDGRLYIYIPDESNEVTYEDLLAEVGDTIWVDSAEYKILISEDPMTIFGIETNGRTFDYQFRFEDYKLINKIGLYFFRFIDFFSYYTSELKGCVINGEVYGDTNVVSVEDDINEMPTKFSLSQNYPNPFNPTTKIKFTIPASPLSFGEGQGVRLIVYDILGNEITTLVNEEKPAGEYEIEFNASNLSSGIYYYQLRAGSYIEAKKMVYLK